MKGEPRRRVTKAPLDMQPVVEVMEDSAHEEALRAYFQTPEGRRKAKELSAASHDRAPKVIEIPERDAWYLRYAINKALMGLTDDLQTLEKAIEHLDAVPPGWRDSIPNLHAHQVQGLKELLECVCRWPEDIRPNYQVIEAAQVAARYLRSNPDV